MGLYITVTNPSPCLYLGKSSPDSIVPLHVEKPYIIIIIIIINQAFILRFWSIP